jgi:hypothetical protein
MPVIGVDAIASRNTANYGSPTWVTVDNLRDVTLGLEVEDFDATVRGVSWVQHLPTLFDLEVTVNALWVTADTGLQAILTAFWGRSAIDMAFTDGNIAVNDADGIRAPFGVFSSTRNEGLRDGLNLDWTLRPYSTGDPTEIPERWITGS